MEVNVKKWESIDRNEAKANVAIIAAAFYANIHA